MKCSAIACAGDMLGTANICLELGTLKRGFLSTVTLGSCGHPRVVTFHESLGKPPHEVEQRVPSAGLVVAEEGVENCERWITAAPLRGSVPCTTELSCVSFAKSSRSATSAVPRQLASGFVDSLGNMMVTGRVWRGCLLIPFSTGMFQM